MLSGSILMLVELEFKFELVVLKHTLPREWKNPPVKKYARTINLKLAV
jgi:hypothetical protein